MSSNDNSLLDFLKKKSLFSYSPVKSSKRSRSKSQESQNFTDRFKNDTSRRDLERLNQKIINLSIPQSSYSPQRRQRFPNTYAHQPSYTDQGYRHNSQNDPIVYQNPSLLSRRKNESSLHAEKGDSKLWAGLSSYGSNFESARVQSAHCLQNLSSKISGQIQSISSKIEAFNSRMFRLLNSEFKAIQERIYRMVEVSFKESEKWIREYMRQKQQMLTGDLTKSKLFLQKQLLMIQNMKEQLHTPNWRKVAGQILSTELEKKIEDTINQTKMQKAGEWNLENFAENHMRKIEDEITLIFRLRS